jgi:hypothetical protein
MSEASNSSEPDWDTPMALTLTPAAIIQAIFGMAHTVHTGWESCVDPSLTVTELNALDEQTDNHCRLVEQEYVEDQAPDVTWHDWTVELKIGEIHVIGHWQAQVNASPSEWEWCAAEAERAFSSACLLLGRRVRKGLVIEEPTESRPAARTRH